MKTLHVIGSRRPGGAETFFARLVNALNRDRPGSAAAAVVPGSPPDRDLDPDVRRQPIPMRGIWDLPSNWRIRRLARDYDLVQTYMGRATRLTRKIPAVHVARVGGFYDPSQYAHADQIVVAARALADHMVRGGIPAARIELIHNFVTPAAPVPPARLEALRTAHDIPDGVPVAVSVARLHPVKGLDTLLSALALLPDDLPLVVALVGEGPLRDQLEDQMRRDALGARVRFVGWQDDTAAWFQLADLAICPSRQEGLGNVILEAWSNGCAALAAEATGPKELIEDGLNGRLVPIDDACELAHAIGELIRDPGARADLAEGGRRTLDERFTERRIVGAYRALYARLLG